MLKRKKYVINKQFQFRFIATMLVLVVLSLIVFSGGFFLYYWITTMMGDNIFDEFIDITKSITINVQVIKQADIINAKSLVEKLKQVEDTLSQYIVSNIPERARRMMDLYDPAEDLPEATVMEIADALSYFLKSTVTKNINIYGKMAKQNLPQEIVEKTRMQLEGEELYKFNLRLLEIAYAGDIMVAENIENMESFSYQKIIPAVKSWQIIIPPLLLNNLLLMIVIIIIGIFYSHRIAGPMYRIETDIQRVLDGEKGIKIRLRRSDNLKTLAAMVNKLIEQLDEARAKKK